MSYLDQKKQKISDLHSKLDKNELKDCTFKPVTNRWVQWEKAKKREISKFVQKQSEINLN
jgi:hypothetical protein